MSQLDSTVHNRLKAIKELLMAIDLEKENVELKEELEKLAPENAVSLVNLPAAATGALVPPSTAAASAPLDLSSLVNTIAEAISSLNRNESDPIIRVYLDGKQLSDAVTKYQRRNERAYG